MRLALLCSVLLFSFACREAEVGRALDPAPADASDVSVADGGPGCEPTACSARECGRLPDGCGGVRECACAAGSRCVVGRCVSRTPMTCADVPWACGTLADGEGGTLDCACARGVCVDHLCCQPRTCADVINACGAIPDGCGGTLTCGCSAGAKCFEGACCVAKTCAQLGKDCGTVSDGCGGTVSCGSCTGSEFCGAGGVDHVCSIIKPLCGPDHWCAEELPPYGFEAAAPSWEHVWFNSGKLFEAGAARVGIGRAAARPMSG